MVFLEVDGKNCIKQKCTVSVRKVNIYRKFDCFNDKMLCEILNSTINFEQTNTLCVMAENYITVVLNTCFADDGLYHGI